MIIWGIEPDFQALSFSTKFVTMLPFNQEGFPMKKLYLNLICILSLPIVLTACAPVMEATRPSPVNLSQFKLGDSRASVISELGSPVSSHKEDQRFCDIYQLYTRGTPAVGRAAIATGEAVADVFTLGLSEVVFTPVEGATRNSKHTVLFCYSSSDNKLISVKEASTDIHN
jgi:hypothetical protein